MGRFMIVVGMALLIAFLIYLATLWVERIIARRRKAKAFSRDVKHQVLDGLDTITGLSSDSFTLDAVDFLRDTVRGR